LFAYRAQSGTLVPLKFLSRCDDVWLQHDYLAIFGHSFRIGGTTELLVLLGIAPHIVKTLGRCSDAFLRYWRCLEHLAPLHAEMVGPRISSVLPSPSA
ncbi:hypothetical protein EDB19DRAFT_1647469, partial [Suillus lakei]